jgi:hypothetical protein
MTNEQLALVITLYADKLETLSYELKERFQAGDTKPVRSSGGGDFYPQASYFFDLVRRMKGDAEALKKSGKV